MPGKHRLYLHCPGEASLCAATSSPPCWLACARCQGMAAPRTKGTTSCNIIFQHLPKAHSAAAGAADSAALPELQGCLRSRLRRTLHNLARSLTSTSLRACEWFSDLPTVLPACAHSCSLPCIAMSVHCCAELTASYALQGRLPQGLWVCEFRSSGDADCSGELGSRAQWRHQGSPQGNRAATQWHLMAHCLPGSFYAQLTP